VNASVLNCRIHDCIGRLSLKTDPETELRIILKRAKGFWNIEFPIASVDDKRRALWPRGYLFKSRDRDRTSKIENVNFRPNRPTTPISICMSSRNARKGPINVRSIASFQQPTLPRYVSFAQVYRWHHMPSATFPASAALQW
jgi:hypothetical protein